MQLSVKYIQENKKLKIQVTYRRKMLFDTSIMIDEQQHKEVKKTKEKLLQEFCKLYPEIDRKDALLAFSKDDIDYKELYKKLYPHGGYRGGGRPKGSRTDKTERLNLAVTPEEKQAVIKFLYEHRKKTRGE